MVSKWAEIFAPTGYSLRIGQQTLGDEIIDVIDKGGILTAQASTGTGKSLATSIPTINKIHECRKKKIPTPRSVISTETITLQNQLCDKDLPFLQKVYGGFTFSKLLGRSNYLCMNRLAPRAVGNPNISKIYTTLQASLPRIITGEYGEICGILGEKIDKETWADMCGSSEDCPNNTDCKEGDGCFGVKARAEANKSDIVVVNHSLLAADAQSKLMGSEDGILGNIDILVIDEAHKLEEVLTNSWGMSSTEWEVNDAINRVAAGVQNVPSLDHNAINELLDQYRRFIEASKDFFIALNESRNQEWKGSETRFALHYLRDPGPDLLEKMEKFEEMGPPVLETMVDTMMKIGKAVLSEKENGLMDNLTGSARKEVNKANASAQFLYEFCSILLDAIKDKTGVVFSKGTTYGVIVDGWVRRKDNTNGMTIRCFPMDVSNAASKMFSRSYATILLSATMTDLTDGTFKYFNRSLGIKNSRELDVKSPFNMDSQQLVYITQANKPVLGNTKFSDSELVDLINASDGRALVLFTSRYELEEAFQSLMQYKIAGRLPYSILVHESDSDKAKLVEEFKSDTSSVLLGLKSFFTGIDIPGEALSQVIICRWPLPRFSTETRMKMDYWRSAGFPKWYERESLTVFQQAAGRLIRSDKCIGAVSLIDQRVYNPRENVFKTAKTGVEALGSRITHDPSDITKHLMKVENETL